VSAVRVWRRPRLGLAAVCLTLAAGAGAALPGLTSLPFEQRETGPSLHLLMVASIALAALAPVAVRAATRRFDPFEPVVLTSLALLVLFVARPLADMFVNHYDFLGRDVSPTYGQALAAALTAAAAFMLAYHAPPGRWLAERTKPITTPADPLKVFNLAIGLLLATLACLLLVLVLGQGVSTLLTARQQGLGQTPVPPILFESLQLAVPTLLLFRVAGRAMPGLSILPSCCAALVILFISVPMGNRRYLLLFLVSAGAWYFVSRGRRPRILPTALVALALMLLVAVPVRESRKGAETYAAALHKTVTAPGEALLSPLVQGDTEQINTLALLIEDLGWRVEFQRGKQFLTNNLLLPIPGEIWTGKPQKVRMLLIEARFGGRDGGCVSFCPTFSMIGDFYSDFGLLSVAIGAAVVGVLFRFAYAYFRRNGHDPIVQAGYCASLWTAFYVWWDSYAYLVQNAVLLGLPFVLTGLLARARAGRQPDPEVTQ
jgi:hypothetical protein